MNDLYDQFHYLNHCLLSGMVCSNEEVKQNFIRLCEHMNTRKADCTALSCWFSAEEPQRDHKTAQQSIKKKVA